MHLFHYSLFSWNFYHWLWLSIVIGLYWRSHIYPSWHKGKVYIKYVGTSTTILGGHVITCTTRWRCGPVDKVKNELSCARVLSRVFNFEARFEWLTSVNQAWSYTYNEHVIEWSKVLLILNVRVWHLMSLSWNILSYWVFFFIIIILTHFLYSTHF